MSPARTKHLVVQLGHCYRTRGATGTQGEQEFATRVGNACLALIHGRSGWMVRTVLADDHDPDHLYGDAFVAIHADGSTNPNARGASIGYRNNAGRAFGQAWKRCYQNRGWTGGFRPDNYTGALADYYGVREAVEAGTAAAFIVEAGFLTNPGDRAILTAADGAVRVAAAIRDALGIREDSGAVPAARKDDSMFFVRGNARRPWSDFVFKVFFPDEAGAIAVREHVPSQNDPGFVLAHATGAGMDPRTGKPWTVDQAVLDALPFVSAEALAKFKERAADHVAQFRAQQQKTEQKTAAP